MLILGLNMFHADASAAIVQDGEVVFAIAEERLNRIKHFAGFPALAVKACLDAVGARITDIDHVAIGQDSDANLIKKVGYALANPAKILNFIRLRQRKEAMRDLRSLLAGALDVDPKLLKFQQHHLEHHIAHIASAYYCSPWEKAAGFSYDGSGDFVSTMMARCEGNEIEVLERVFLPHSLGSFYTMICEFIGYKKYGDEGKVMGLAPYGKDTYCKAVERDCRPDRRSLSSSTWITSCRWAAIRVCKSVMTARYAWQDIPPIVWNNMFGKAARAACGDYATRYGSGVRDATSLRGSIFFTCSTSCTGESRWKIWRWPAAAP